MKYFKSLRRVIFKLPMKKYVLIIPVFLGAFFAGMYYENNRIIVEPDTTIAVLLSAQAINNTRYQLQLNSEYLELIENEQLNKLRIKLNSNSQLLISIKSDAESVCIKPSCSSKHLNILNNAIND